MNAFSSAKARNCSLKNVPTASFSVRSNTSHPWLKNTIWGGQAPGAFTWDTIVDAIRDERIRDASGLRMFISILLSWRQWPATHTTLKRSRLSVSVRSKTIAGYVSGHLSRNLRRPHTHALDASCLSSGSLENHFREVRRKCIGPRWSPAPIMVGSADASTTRSTSPCARQAACDRIYTFNVRRQFPVLEGMTSR